MRVGVLGSIKPFRISSCSSLSPDRKSYCTVALSLTEGKDLIKPRVAPDATFLRRFLPSLRPDAPARRTHPHLSLKPCIHMPLHGHLTTHRVTYYPPTQIHTSIRTQDSAVMFFYRVIICRRQTRSLPPHLCGIFLPTSHPSQHVPREYCNQHFP